MFVILVDSDCSQECLHLLLFRSLLGIPAHLTRNILPSYEGYLKEVVFLPAAIIYSTKKDHWILPIGDL